MARAVVSRVLKRTGLSGMIDFEPKGPERHYVHDDPKAFRY